MLVKAIFINLLLLAIYCTLIITGSAASDRGFSIAIGGGICMALQVGLNVVSGFIILAIGKRHLAIALLVSGGVVAGVGFVSWLILLSIYG
ncbi:hypothetical protein QWY86_15230 [Pedobacter aquatilis]|uniref:hypothetical protein n=1 Tax=Pedobacter aquatilis TaxID=351343 RepID=UPI0025B35621|nr:hypothetical protein [Pedobacter aquatilis]MDN3588034.1 hypothetical protein [Pedobacter aquatilis]